MLSILFAVGPLETDQLTADLWERGVCGIIESGDQMRAFFVDSAAVEDLQRRYQILEITQESDIADFEISREGWDSVLVGDRFFIAPSWLDEPTPLGRIRLSIDTTTSFGTGRHESTQLMLQAMEERLERGMTVVDIGSGSGILSTAAQHLGAERVFSCDIQQDALSSTSLNPRFSSFIGSADAIIENMADLALVNISAKILDALAFDLRRIMKPAGHLLISGFIEENTPRRFSPERVWQQGDWLCWSCRPHAIEVPSHNETLGIRVHPQQWW